MIPTVLEILHPAQANRRDALRFPFESPVTYTVRGVDGAGQSLNLGSHGMLISTETQLKVGCTIEITMQWPVLLNGTCPLKFVATGRVVRSDARTAAVRLERYEFRTRGKVEVAA